MTAHVIPLGKLSPRDIVHDSVLWILFQLTECSDSIPRTKSVINSRDSESNSETQKREKDQRPDKLGPLSCTHETQTAASSYSDIYSGTPLKGHPWNEDTSLIRTLDQVPTSYKYVLFAPWNEDTPLIRTHGVRIRGVPLYIVMTALQKHEVFLYHIYGYLCSISDIAWVYKNIHYIAWPL